MEHITPRQRLVEADLRCLMCGRLIGHLAGLVARDARLRPAGEPAVSWLAFRPGNPGELRVQLTGREQFRCRQCGGMAVMEEITVSMVRESPPTAAACPIHRERVQGRGRRPKGCQCNELAAAA
ncbi:MAG TPA: hypothetical protein VGQ62_09295 [Chloroflexota bacterium]|jgi:hypothetical protein|nr:hypothetical protein [Chloroflexota bacterium]